MNPNASAASMLDPTVPEVTTAPAQEITQRQGEFVKPVYDLWLTEAVRRGDLDPAVVPRSGLAELL